MRSVTEVINKYYISHHNIVYIFKIVSINTYTPFYDIGAKIFVDEAILRPLNPIVPRTFFSKREASKIINFHATNNMKRVDIDSVLNIVNNK
jgi:hypothetical protein